MFHHNTYLTFTKATFHANAVRWPRHLVIAETAELLTVIQAIYTRPWRGSWFKTHEQYVQVHPISEENNTFVISIAEEVAAVYYKLAENQESQITKHAVAQSDDSKRLSLDWFMKVQVSGEYAEYRKEFLLKLSNSPIDVMESFRMYNTSQAPHRTTG